MIGRKVRSLAQVKPLKDWDLPKEFEKLRKILESRDGTAGKREYVKVLKLNGEYKKEKIAEGIRAVINNGCINYDGIFMSIQQINRVSISNLTYLPISDISVPKSNLAEYMQLL